MNTELIYIIGKLTNIVQGLLPAHTETAVIETNALAVELRMIHKQLATLVLGEGETIVTPRREAARVETIGAPTR